MIYRELLKGTERGDKPAIATGWVEYHSYRLCTHKQ